MERVRLFKINERGVIGWVEQKRVYLDCEEDSLNPISQTTKLKHILHYIDFESLNFRFIEE